MAAFHPWRATYNKMLAGELVAHKVGYRTIIDIAAKAWDGLFPVDDAGQRTPNMGIVRAFADAGIMPPNRNAIPATAFMPAEAAGKAMEAARLAAGAVPRTTAEEVSLVDEAIPFAPPIPVNVEKARQVARRNRKTSSELLTRSPNCCSTKRQKLRMTNVKK